MGGDHRCSVCQATFTRPQHVARHMRSHTGDRPYKCQYCGDQFARSDLLSRHVNKCHPNEKSPPTAGNTRRKGSASASRATTSKQACDQCVQSSLPCDGCNPCAKCVQKECRCTFVKFHRQTAPVGPGHNPRPSPSSSRISMYPQGQEYADSSPLSVPSMPESLYYQKFDFLDAQPSNNQYDPALPNPTSDPAKYRAQEELIRRGGIAPTQSDTQISSQPLYVDPQAIPSWGDWSQNTLEAFNNVPSNSHNAIAARHLLDENAQFAFSRLFMTPDDPTFSGQNATSNSTGYPMRGTNGDNFWNRGISLAHGHIRRGSHDLSSDGSHPSSAASSIVHLPLEVSSVPQQPYQDMAHDTAAQVNYSPVVQSQGHSSHMENRPPPLAGPEGFSSAFGLLSLDDPNVLAGLANDGVPFFSGGGIVFPDDPNATPIPSKHTPSSRRNNHVDDHNQSSQPTPGTSREAETRELREFWRAYMRTPLTGPGAPPLETTHTATQNQTPSSTGQRRVRVSSLPSVKTPTVEGGQPHFPPREGGIETNVTSSIRTTLNGPGDDLRSYEAAVLARKAPMNLNLVPRKGRGESSVSPQVRTRPPDRPNSFLPATLKQDVKFDFNEADSSPSVSSLANAFGKPETRSSRVLFAADHQRANEDFSSRDSCVTRESLAPPKGVLRPSFKRLPSQTLGPATSKRTQLSPDSEGQDEEEDVNMPMRSGGDGNPGNISKTLGYNGTHHSSRPIVGLASRRRRMSAPNIAPPLVLVGELGDACGVIEG